MFRQARWFYKIDVDAYAAVQQAEFKNAAFFVQTSDKTVSTKPVLRGT